MESPTITTLRGSDAAVVTGAAAVVEVAGSLTATSDAGTEASADGVVVGSTPAAAFGSNTTSLFPASAAGSNTAGRSAKNSVNGTTNATAATAPWTVILFQSGRCRVFHQRPSAPRRIGASISR